jgi:hypothetical protein
MSGLPAAEENDRLSNATKEYLRIKRSADLF